MRKIIAFTLAVVCVFIASGHNLADSVKVYFCINQGQFDPMLANNSVLMDSFVDRVRMAADSQRLDSIIVRAYASPDGPSRVNRRLSEERCNSIVNQIIERTRIGREFIHDYSEGVAWTELRRIVAETPEVPYREQVLEILDNTPLYIYNSRGRVVDGRKKRLMSLARGVPYRWMFNHLFPQLRNAVAVSVYLNTDTCVRIVADNNAADTTVYPVYESDTIIFNTIIPDTTSVSLPVTAGEQQDVDIVSPSVSIVDSATTILLPPPLHRFALKTNILYYAALLPNLEFEWLINKNWSVAIEGDVAYWNNRGLNKYYDLTIISAEGRRWIKPRAPWHGMYVGAFASGGWYDFENGGIGYYGEGGMGGLSFGYMWPISRNLSLEAGIGAGYMYTRYKEYEPRDGHYLYMRTKSLSYIGPLKAKFSIVWRFLDKNKINLGGVKR